jgi:heme exporter protein B
MSQDAAQKSIVQKPAVEQRSAVTSFFQAIQAIIWKDLAAEWRSRELISAMLVFALLVIFIFSGTLGLNRSLAMEKDRGCLDGLLLAPVDRTAIYFGKMIANLIFMLVMALIVLPIYTVLYNINVFNWGLFAVILLGSEGYMAVGTLLAAMSVQTRTRDILLPILLFPVIIPVLVASVKASGGFLQGAPMDEIIPWINLLLVYDVVFTALAFMVFEFVVEE